MLVSIAVPALHALWRRRKISSHFEVVYIYRPIWHYSTLAVVFKQRQYNQLTSNPFCL